MMEMERVRLEQLISEALSLADKIADARGVEYAPERSGAPRIDKGLNERRAYTLKDAKYHARHIAKGLREAWDIVDPVSNNIKPIVHTPQTDQQA